MNNARFASCAFIVVSSLFAVAAQAQECNHEEVTVMTSEMDSSPGLRQFNLVLRPDHSIQELKIYKACQDPRIYTVTEIERNNVVIYSAFKINASLLHAPVVTGLGGTLTMTFLKHLGFRKDYREIEFDLALKEGRWELSYQGKRFDSLYFISSTFLGKANGIEEILVKEGGNVIARVITEKQRHTTSDFPIFSRQANKEPEGIEP